jgi:hypothetical protein
MWLAFAYRALILIAGVVTFFAGFSLARSFFTQLGRLSFEARGSEIPKYLKIQGGGGAVIILASFGILYAAVLKPFTLDRTREDLPSGTLKEILTAGVTASEILPGLASESYRQDTTALGQYFRTCQAEAWGRFEDLQVLIQRASRDRIYMAMAPSPPPVACDSFLLRAVRRHQEWRGARVRLP